MGPRASRLAGTDLAGFVRNHHLYPAVELAASGVVVTGHRKALAIAHGLQAVLFDSGAHQDAFHRFRPALGQLLVEGLTACTVSKALNHGTSFRVLLKVFSQLLH